MPDSFVETWPKAVRVGALWEGMARMMSRVFVAVKGASRMAGTIEGVKILVVEGRAMNESNSHRRVVVFSDTFVCFLLTIVDNKVYLNPGDGALLLLSTYMSVVESSIFISFSDDFLLASLLPIGNTLKERLQ
jgi:hypothetical protein